MAKFKTVLLCISHDFKWTMTKFLLGNWAETSYPFKWAKANGKVTLCIGSFSGGIDEFLAALKDTCNMAIDDSALDRIVEQLKLEVKFAPT